MSHNYKMTRAYNEQKLVTNIEDVQRGLKCNCTCVDCGAKLIAKKGPIQANHFSHAPDDKKALNCKWSFETELHLLAKEVLNDYKKLTIPIGNFDPYDLTLDFDYVDIEPSIDNSKRIPDVVGYSKGESVLIEIAVSHFSEANKISEYRRLNKNAIEFDFSHFTPSSEVITLKEVYTLFESSNAKWLSISPAGYIGELCHAHERQKIKDLIAARRQFMSEYGLEKTKLTVELESLKEQLQALSSYKDNIEVIIRKDEYIIRERYRNQNRALLNSINNASRQLEALNKELTDKTNIKNEINEYEAKLINEIKANNQNLINDKRKLLEDISKLQSVKDFTIEDNKQRATKAFQKEKERLVIIFNEHLESDISELSLKKSKLESDIKQLHENINNAEKSLNEKKAQFDTLEVLKHETETEKKRLEELEKYIIRQNRLFSTAAKNIVRITPDLKELTRKAGIPWPFAHNLVDELSKVIK